MESNSRAVLTRCNELKQFWAPRNKRMQQWYKLIQMVDELKTDKMESFVGNDPRSMYNLVLHMLDTKIPYRLKIYDLGDYKLANASAEVSRLLDLAWNDVEDQFRHTGPRQDLKRAIIGLLLATGWYSIFSIVKDDGSGWYIDVWNPAEVYPMWDSDMGLSETAHIFPVSATRARMLVKHNNWKLDMVSGTREVQVYDYWWLEMSNEYPYRNIVWNAIVVGGTLVKFLPTRFYKIPIYVAPVGGLPDTGPLSEQPSNNSVTASDRWKEEIGQSILATNENIYRTWNKWWTFSMQLLRDTAQPRVLEKSRSGKAIVRPEDVFRRGAIFRGGPEDSVEFLSTPPMPLELRSTQLDLEAMMQRGGVSWAMYGSVSGQLSAYVMSQISSSANQPMRPFQKALQNLYADIGNDGLDDIRDRGVHPYGWSIPEGLPSDAKVSADFEVEIPGDLVQRATVARMLDPDFRLPFSYVLQKLFPEIKSPMQTIAQIRADKAELHPTNGLIALIVYYRKQALELEDAGDIESAKLYRLAAQATEMELEQVGGSNLTQEPRQIGPRPEGGTPPTPAPGVY